MRKTGTEAEQERDFGMQGWEELDVRERFEIRKGTLSGQEQSGFNGMIVPEWVTMDAPGGEIVLRFRVFDWMRDPFGDLAGGGLMALVDSAFGYSSCSTYDHLTRAMSTVSIDAQFPERLTWRPAVRIVVRVVRIEGDLIFLSCRITDDYDNAETIATAQGQYYKYDL